ncbi:MAG TPA: hypothetical protein PLC89_26515 [Haliscomenobacter sp.]|nr:hypothetical protein [Haliscomenobacter sp.]HOY20896.1 hypothetical protein [Haliscomenobacter sp.]
MKSPKLLVLGLMLIAGLGLNAQTENSKSEMEQISATLMDCTINTY